MWSEKGKPIEKRRPPVFCTTPTDIPITLAIAVSMIDSSQAKVDKSHESSGVGFVIGEMLDANGAYTDLLFAHLPGTTYEPPEYCHPAFKPLIKQGIVPTHQWNQMRERQLEKLIPRSDFADRYDPDGYQRRHEKTKHFRVEQSELVTLTPYQHLYDKKAGFSSSPRIETSDQLNNVSVHSPNTIGILVTDVRRIRAKDFLTHDVVRHLVALMAAYDQNDCFDRLLQARAKQSQIVRQRKYYSISPLILETLPKSKRSQQDS